MREKFGPTSAIYFLVLVIPLSLNTNTVSHDQLKWYILTYAAEDCNKDSVFLVHIVPVYNRRGGPKFFIRHVHEHSPNYGWLVGLFLISGNRQDKQKTSHIVTLGIFLSCMKT